MRLVSNAVEIEILPAAPTSGPGLDDATKADTLSPQEQKVVGVWRFSKTVYSDDGREGTELMILNPDRTWLMACYHGKDEIPKMFWKINCGPRWTCYQGRLQQYFPPPKGGGEHRYDRKILSVTPTTLAFEYMRKPELGPLTYNRVSRQTEVAVRNLLETAPPRAVLRGTVTGPDGKPAAGYEVSLSNSSGARFGEQTGDDGTYEFVYVPAGEYQLWANPTANGQPIVGLKSVRIEADKTLRRDLSLERKFSISGRVTFADGAPAPGREVMTTWRSADGSAEFGDFAAAGPDGRYTVSAPFETATYVGLSGTGPQPQPYHNVHAGRSDLDFVTEHPWGPAVEGVQVRLRADKREWKAGETPKLIIDVRHQGDQKLVVRTVLDAVDELQVDGQSYRHPPEDLTGVLWQPLNPGDTRLHALTVTIDKEWLAVAGKKPLALAPGKHSVRFAWQGYHQQQDKQTPFPDEAQPVRLVSNAVEIEILPAEAKPADAKPAAPAAEGSRGNTEGKWSWTAGGNKSDGLTGWEQALEDATKYVLGNQPRQKEALRLYQRVLDANPPRTLALHVKLIMAARMTILYNPDLGEQSHEEEALRWCQRVLQDYEDWPTHHDAMVAKIYLGDLYCWDRPGREDREKATRLYWEVIEVPEDEIVFDDPEMSNLNMDKIAVAKHPGGGRRIRADGTFITEPTEEMNNDYRKMLLEGRKESVCALRRAAIRALAYKQGVPGDRQKTRERLLELKQRRPGDQVYQETLNAILRNFPANGENTVPDQGKGATNTPLLAPPAAQPEAGVRLPFPEAEQESETADVTRLLDKAERWNEVDGVQARERLVAMGGSGVPAILIGLKKSANADPRILDPQRIQDFGRRLRAAMHALAAIGDRRALPAIATLTQYEFPKAARASHALRLILAQGSPEQIQSDAKSETPAIAKAAARLLNNPDELQRLRNEAIQMRRQTGGRPGRPGLSPFPPTPSTSPPAAEQASPDLDALVTSLTREVGGQWGKDLHNAFPMDTKIIRGRVYSAPGKVLVAYDVFPFGSQDPRRATVFEIYKSKTMRLLGTNDALAVFEDARGDAAMISEKITQVLSLKPMDGAAAQPARGEAVGGLKCSLALKQTSLNVGDEIKVEVEFQNVSDKPISFDYPTDYAAGLLTVRDANGRPVNSTMTGVSGTPRPGVWMRNKPYRTLKPGEAFKAAFDGRIAFRSVRTAGELQRPMLAMDFQRDLMRFDLVDPGRFTVELRLAGNERTIAELERLKVESPWKGALSSNAVDFQVTAATREELDAAIAMAQKGEVDQRRQAINLLAAHADPKATSALMDTLLKGPEELRADAAAALQAIGDASVAGTLVAEYRKAGSAKQRQLLLGVLEATPDWTQQWPLYLEIAKSGATREEKEQAYDRLILVGRPEVVPVLIAAAHSGDPMSQRAAIDNISRLLENLSGILERKLPPETIATVTDDLIGLLKQDRDATVRSRAAQALGHASCDKVLTALVEALKDADAFVGSYAANSLGRIGGPEAIPALEQYVQAAPRDSQKDAGRKAIESIRTRQSAPPPAAAAPAKPDDELKALRQSLTRPAEYGLPKKSLPAVERLVEIGSAEAVQILYESLRNPLVSRNIKLHALPALGRIGSKEALKAYEDYQAWAAKFPPYHPFMFGPHESPMDHFADQDVAPLVKWSAGSGQTQREFAVFRWGRYGEFWLWLVSRAPSGTWDTPGLLAMSAGDAGRIGMAEHLTGVYDAGRLVLKGDHIDLTVEPQREADDADKDGVPDALEAMLGTDPKKADSDGDGTPDGNDSNPLTPRPAQVSEDMEIRQAAFLALFGTSSTRDAANIVWDAGANRPAEIPEWARQEYYGMGGYVLRSQRIRQGIRMGWVNITGIDINRKSATEALVTIGDYEGNAAASSHEIVVKRLGRLWVPVSVRMTVIS